MAFLGDVLKHIGKLGLKNLNEFQNQAIMKILSSKNTALLAEPAAGKTLAYILAVSAMNLPGKRAVKEVFKLENLFKEQGKTVHNSRPHGSLILVPTHERSAEVYRKIRTLAPWLSVNRAACTVASVIGTFGKDPQVFANDEDYDKEGFKNIVKGVDWNSTDVLIATPTVLNEMVEFRAELNMPSLNPSLIVIDEIDWILESSDISQRIKKAFDYIEDCNERQFVLSSSILPYSAFSPDPIAILRKDFKEIQLISNKTYDIIPETLKVNFYVDSKQKSKMKILEELLVDRKSEKIAIISNHISRCSDIRQMCIEKGLNSYLFTPNLHFEDRLCNRSDQSSLRKEEGWVVIGNELVCRGFDVEADHVILYNLPSSISSLLNRVGCVNKLANKGQITFLLEENEGSFENNFRPGESWSSLFYKFSKGATKKVHSLFAE